MLQFLAKKWSIILCVIALGSAANLAHATIITVGSENYEVTTVVGSHGNLTSALESTPWWGNVAAASDAALQVLGALGTNSNTSVPFPLFAYDAPGGNANARYWTGTGTITDRIFYPQSNFFRYTFAVATLQPPVSAPEPATLALLGLGLAGVGFSRRKAK